MLRSPKERFVESSYSGAWGKITQGVEFEEAIHAALLELAFDMPIKTEVPQQAADAHQQMAGARKYMDILCSLHQPNIPTKTTQHKDLDYQAGV